MFQKITDNVRDIASDSRNPYVGNTKEVSLLRSKNNTVEKLKAERRSENAM